MPFGDTEGGNKVTWGAKGSTTACETERNEVVVDRQVSTGDAGGIEDGERLEEPLKVESPSQEEVDCVRTQEEATESLRVQDKDGQNGTDGKHEELMEQVAKLMQRVEALEASGRSTGVTTVSEVCETGDVRDEKVNPVVDRVKGNCGLEKVRRRNVSYEEERSDMHYSSLKDSSDDGRRRRRSTRHRREGSSASLDSHGSKSSHGSVRSDVGGGPGFSWTTFLQGGSRSSHAKHAKSRAQDFSRRKTDTW
jgi:hypothetical protein